jgi:hypothetical protein
MHKPDTFSISEIADLANFVSSPFSVLPAREGLAFAIWLFYRLVRVLVESD